MAYVRVVHMRIPDAWRQEALRIQLQLMAVEMENPKCLFQGTGDPNTCGERTLIGLWEGKQAAMDAATQPVVLMLRSQLMLLCEAPPRVEEYELAAAMRHGALRDISAPRSAPRAD